jgi:hypothetical protein
VGTEGTTANHHRSRWPPAVGLGAIAVLVAAVGLAIAAAQHPQGPLIPRPSPVASATPSPFPTPAAAGPVSALGASVADDPATHRVVLFGGVDSTNKTWLWDGRHWAPATPPGSPPNRAGAAAAYDPATRVVMLFGGSGSTPGQAARLFNDTWAWNGITWRRLDSGGRTGPFVGDGGQMAWDAARADMVLVTSAGTLTDGETWTWDGTRWVREAHGDLAAIVVDGTMTYDPVSQMVLLVTPAIGNNAHTTTFGWNGSTWHLVVTDGPQLDGLAMDTHVGRTVACGSVTSSAVFAVQASCWEWAITGWFPLQTAFSPKSATSVTVAAEVDDVDRAQLLLIGWLVPPAQNQAQPLYVWAWDGVKWRLLP